MNHIGCKHLDYSDNYVDCEIVVLPFEMGQHWRRNAPPYQGAPVNVQFCGQGRGRINGIFQCINEGEMGCFEKQEADALLAELDKEISA